ncbi:hypothetical protein BBJ28_00020249, partial [Nothophytophthora sp. Chile5]
ALLHAFPGSPLVANGFSVRLLLACRPPAAKDAAEKPSIEEFTQGKPLGEGNFSRIVEATHKASRESFALKVIEKQRVKRLHLRHQNIFNEINMEKDVLNRLRHPNIIRLYQTFQDDSNLYFLLEFLDGGELLSHLLHEGRQLGVDEDLARFYLVDVVNAVEFMHANQVLHRDLKPENMVTCKDSGGHLKLIDFGTVKNLADSALNGPSFVGTPEYMPPETINNKEPTYASDSWALGCIIYQLLTGETPFSGGSAYLTFLRVQDGSYHVPEYLSDEAKDLIAKLLKQDPNERLGGTKMTAMHEIKGDRHKLAIFRWLDGSDWALHSWYIGLTHDMQNQWSDQFSFMQLSGPKLGRVAALAEADARGGSTWEVEADAFRRAIAALNEKRPAFVVICGDFVNATPGQEFHDAQSAAFQDLLSEINPQVRLLREKYWTMIRNGQACLLVNGNAALDSVTSIVTKAAEEDADEYKCELVSCKAPWSDSSCAIHSTTVSQEGVSTKAFRVVNASSSSSSVDAVDPAIKHSATPEEEGQEVVLAAEMVTLDVTSNRSEE